MHSFPTGNSALARLVKISQFIINDPGLVEEMIQEVKLGNNGPLCSMFKNIFKKNQLSELSPIPELSQYFFSLNSISELTIFSSPQVGISCFFMPKNSYFPLHDHNNRIVCTGVVYGKIRYMTLNRTIANHYSLSSKGTALNSKVMFGTKDFRNIHSLLAVEDSIIIDIFLPNSDEGDQSNLFNVKQKRNRDFVLSNIRTCGSKKKS